MNARLTLLLAAAAVSMATYANASSSVPHVHQAVHRRLKESGKVNIVVTMRTPPTETMAVMSDLTFDSRGEKIQHMVSELTALADASQSAIDEMLMAEATTTADAPLFEKQHKSWAMNARLFQGATVQLVEKLATLDDVAEIREEEVYTLAPIEGDDASSMVSETATPLVNTIEWGVDRISATKVWAQGNIGQGTVVANIDTGVRFTHERLASNFRATHNWYDPDNETDAPADNNGHGTHTMGTIAGSKGLGVAPGAQWIACLGCPGSCPEFNLVKCGEWMTCPTDTKGQNADCSKAPHVINNSWGGSGGRNYFEPVVAAWHAAGIVPVFSQGNSGPSCGSAGSPGDYESVIGVGATDAADGLAYFSSKGPAVGTGLLKPDVSAPGHYVPSAWSTSDTAYRTISGTSMAAPHVTGAVALLLANDPSLTFDAIRDLVANTTDVSTLIPSNYTCGGTDDATWPNNQYGYGRLNVFAAFEGERQTPAE